MSKAIIIGRYIPPKGKALIKAKKLKKDEGRLTINEAMRLLQEKTDEFFNLSKAVKAGEILTYAPGSRKALQGDADNCSDDEEAYPADLNAWLAAKHPRVGCCFSVPATEPTPVADRGEVETSLTVQSIEPSKGNPASRLVVQVANEMEGRKKKVTVSSVWTALATMLGNSIIEDSKPDAYLCNIGDPDLYHLTKGAVRGILSRRKARQAHR